MFQALQRQGVIVRPMRAYKMPEWVRVTVGLPAENRRFIHALTAILSRQERDPRLDSVSATVV